MPQGRRKVPFSGKQKKEQLSKKRNTKQTVPNIGGDNEQTVTSKFDDHVAEPEEESKIIDKVTSQTKATKNDYMVDVNFSSGNTGRQKYDLIFQKESKEEIMKNKELVRKPLKMADPKDLEMDIDQLFPEGKCDYPSRPTWDSKMSKDQVESNEAKYFRKYVNDIMIQNEQNLSYFELNLETWRQLWRVTEMADILLLIVDSRFPTAMVPPSLIVNLAPKPVILVLNKIDLIPPELALAWRTYFTEKFSNVKKVTFFTSYPAYNLRKQPYAEEQGGQHGLQGKKLRGRILMAKEGAIQIVDAVNECTQDLDGEKVDIASWREKIASVSSKDVGMEEELVKKIDEENKAIITLGMIGAPNVGKSSLINSLMGKVVVSVSKTPGHTKHFQTIFITPSVKLVDCPGLVFPSIVPKRLQVILGSFPIAQTRDPLSVVQYLAERIDLPSILKLELPKDRSKWTTYDICEGKL